MSDEYISGTLAEINTVYAKKQPHMLNFLLEETSILERIKFVPSSHGLWNAYEEITNIKSAGFVEMNAPLPQMGVDSDLKKIDLSIMGGEMFVPEDKAQMMGGADAYFAKRTPSLLKMAGQETEKKFIYKNVFEYAKKNGKLKDAGGQRNCYSMYVVRQVEGENCGLYSPDGFESGAILNVKKINGGDLMKDPTTGVLGYGLRMKGYFGFQLANPDGVSGIVNITPENIPTAEQIDDMIIEARANPSANCFIMCHPKVLSMLNKYKGNILQAQTSTKDIDRTFMAWNGIRFVTSYNFLNGAEKKVTLA